MITVFGIKNCDTIKKARKWFESQNIDYQFHDYRADGLDQDWLKSLLAEHGWEIILNKKGTTYRQLPEDKKANIDNESALALLMEHPAMIKRPIVQSESDIAIGFKESEYASKFA
ncbi:ArsC family reductase [Paraneptunicella aestuarii]|uniref:ArsC family reductase n=1 Tax=Paraneptunicella aestuarii TaxID=2831148 RepID=UPI001E642A14|nr:ArsC family reductase [Paraneptunicella aestuarii]UAA37262.1 ArsC family reductase [Paraneptunicella aestuarii]